MPTIFIFFGFRFMFYSNDHTPVHVHIIKDGHKQNEMLSLSSKSTTTVSRNTIF